MMTKTKSLVALLALLLVGMGCQNENHDTPALDTEAIAAAYDIYGETFAPEAATPVQAAIDAPADFAGKTVKLEGQVSKVCQMQGCWLTLQGNGENVRIMVARNEDGGYAFTVPTDISGRRVVVEGTFAEVEMDAATAQHMAEDEAGEAHHEMGEGDDHHADGDGGHHDGDEGQEHHEMDGDGAAKGEGILQQPTRELQLTARGVLIAKS